MKQIGLQSSLARSEANDQITTVLMWGEESHQSLSSARPRLVTHRLRHRVESCN